MLGIGVVHEVLRTYTQHQCLTCIIHERDRHPYQLPQHEGFTVVTMQRPYRKGASLHSIFDE